jgi:phosphohistidine phosphatase
MELYILRHAIAVPRDNGEGPHDEDRRLTEQGIEKLREVVRGMRALDLSFDRVLTSPYVRSRQTAEFVAAGLGIEETVEPCPHLAPDGDPEALITAIKAAAAAPRTLLVGHEPALSRLISTLASGDPRAALVLKKAGLCKLTAETLRHGRCARLEWLLPPAILRRIR